MTESSQGARPRLLLVDDEEGILSALRRTLRREGYSIRTARNAVEGLAALEEEAADLVLSDHMMPGMTGLDFLSEVKRRRPQAICFLISGWSQAVTRGELEKAGIGGLIPKPWDDGQLKETLRSVLPESPA